MTLEIPNPLDYVSPTIAMVLVWSVCGRIATYFLEGGPCETSAKLVRKVWKSGTYVNEGPRWIDKFLVYTINLCCCYFFWPVFLVLKILRVLHFFQTLNADYGVKH